MNGEAGLPAVPCRASDPVCANLHGTIRILRPASRAFLLPDSRPGVGSLYSGPIGAALQYLKRPGRPGSFILDS
jgi:hypothetical protein